MKNKKIRNKLIIKMENKGNKPFAACATVCTTEPKTKTCKKRRKIRKDRNKRKNKQPCHVVYLRMFSRRS